MNKTTKKIITYLDANARMSYSELARRAHVSQQTISYNVQKLQDEGVIEDFYTVIDYAKLGMLLFRVYFKISYTKERTLEEILQYLKEHKHIAQVRTCGGSYDLLVTFFAPNPSQFNKVLRSITSKFSNQLREYTILTTIVERNFGRKYLDRRVPHPQLFVGGDRVPEKLSRQELQLLSKLAIDARIPALQIADAVGIAPKTAISWMKEFEDKNIILGYKTQVDIKSVGLYASLLLIRYHNVSTEMEQKLTAFLKQHPNVLNTVKTLGEWDIEVEVEVDDSLNLRKIERELRESFASMIHDIVSLQLYDTTKLQYFPQMLLS